MGVVYSDDVRDHLPFCFSAAPRVVDGDTIECEGMRLRLDGFDTPETKPEHSQCDAIELPVGNSAACALQNLIRSSPWTVQKVSKTGGHNRWLVRLSIDGADVKHAMIGTRLAKPTAIPSDDVDWCSEIELERLSEIRIACDVPVP